MKTFESTKSVVISLLLIAVACVACHSPLQEVPGEAGTAGVPFFTREDHALPLLTTNEVLHIALDIAKSNKFSLQGYVCTGMYFGGQSTNDWITGRWIVNFNLNPPASDYDVFVVIEDRTGKGRLYSR